MATMMIFQVIVLVLCSATSADHVIQKLSSGPGSFRPLSMDKKDRRLQYGYGNYSFLECPEMYCYPSVYMEDGELDWEATMMEVTYTCATYEKGCPCNEEWEIECESYGYKTCYPKSEGCFDPFAVTCNDETEHVCKDEWSAYCWDRAWGSCPVTWRSDEVYCSSYTYDSQGNVNWTAPMTQSCANATTGCPCDEQWEDKCTDSWGYSWCSPKTYPCPITCAEDQQVCYSTVYLETGEPDWSAAGNQSCAPMEGSCPCHPTYEEKCNSSWGSYCQATHGGYSCPIECTGDQHYCWSTPYDEFGNVNYSAPWKKLVAHVMPPGSRNALAKATPGVKASLTVAPWIAAMRSHAGTTRGIRAVARRVAAPVKRMNLPVRIQQELPSATRRYGTETPAP